MSWASFYIVEVMSSAKFLHKRTGYLAATVSFQQDTDVLMLTTNLIKKDLASPNIVDISIALNGLSHIVTPDLARDVSPDLVSMLNHSRPYIRKKIVLVLYKIFLKYPEALRLSFPRLKEKLEDPDPSVISAVVSVICELARKNPKNYLSLAPHLFKLLTTSSNNWMLIKIIKLFASLTPLEPRLIKKLLPPLTTLIQTTPAMSLLYECIYTVITGGFLEAAGAENGHALAKTCTTKLRKFLEDPDQNLKYVGLLAMGKLLLTHPKLVGEHKDIILECIDDEDISIRLRALDLVVGMVNRKNLQDIVKRLMNHILPPTQSHHTEQLNLHDPDATTDAYFFDPAYRTDIIHRIIFMCSQNHYQHLIDFEWYLDILMRLTYETDSVGEVITQQFMDVSVRVKSVREYAVQLMSQLLRNTQFLEKQAKKRNSNLPHVLSAAAWICGEYCHYLQDIPTTLECLFYDQSRKQQQHRENNHTSISATPSSLLPSHVQIIYVQSIIKIYAYWSSQLVEQWHEELEKEFVKVTQKMVGKMDGFLNRGENLEVQERASNVKEIFLLVLEAVQTKKDEQVLNQTETHEPPTLLLGLSDLFFMYELNPVAPKAQSKVPIPQDLDLDSRINEPLPDLIDDLFDESSDEQVEDGFKHKRSTSKKYKTRSGRKQDSDEAEEEKERRRAARREARKNDPYYIHDDASSRKSKSKLDDSDIESIPIVELHLDEAPIKVHRKSKSKKLVKKPVYAEEEMPEDATLSDNTEEPTKAKTKKTSSTRASAQSSNTSSSSMPSLYTKRNAKYIFDTNEVEELNSVDLSTPLGEDERFEQPKVYSSPEEVRMKEEARYRKEMQKRMYERKQLKEEQKLALSSTKKPKKKKSSTKGKDVDVPDSNSEKKTSARKIKKKRSSTATAAATQQQNEKREEEALAEVELGNNELIEEPQPPQHHNQPLTNIFENDDIEMSVRLNLTNNKIMTPEQNTVSIYYTIRNKLDERMLPKVYIEIIDNETAKLIDHHEQHNDIASIRERFELQAKEAVECVGDFEVPQVQKGITVRGDLFYDVEDSSAIHQHSFEIPIPVTLFFITPSAYSNGTEAMDPTAFATLLSEYGYEFEYHEHIDIPVPNPLALQEAFEQVTRASGLLIVEVVAGAASLYGKTAQGAQVAGLLKFIVEADGDSIEIYEQKKAILSMELKCTDQDLLEGLMDELKKIKL
ncbi:adaptin N terminal region-domain-containing protein [Mycotypha africana]|uniref:adaptin N terminal region-domain-containing protein n=1 Tax=Mycotypha africana TaxID=64632 RepID=UPI0023003F88|nr:adaptin N terminal region-domain-containing protein [Mycotypha africana]KAI8984777.1 adaptin N terminal region-domain-containing protein [Mycotypha africana]